MNHPIVAISSPPGRGAIALVRLSGEGLAPIVDAFFVSKNLANGLKDASSHRQYFGEVRKDNTVLDEVMLCFMAGPRTYTGEDTVEIACHGSPYIQQELLRLALQNGAQLAEPGEFTFRAFLNGKMDLAQAESVADLIHSESEAHHRIALQNMRGGFSNELQTLRKDLIRLAALMELELDFSEEDVTFADRTELTRLLTHLRSRMTQLLNSFSLGNALKKGVPIAIVGAPNVGKSSLLNRLLKDEKAIVSSIAGTTRDTVEDVLTLSGIPFRFVDTAGLRTTDDVIEQAGIDRAHKEVDKAEWVLYVYDEAQNNPEVVANQLKAFTEKRARIVLIQNKIDCTQGFHPSPFKEELERLMAGTVSIEKHMGISTLTQEGLPELQETLVQFYEVQQSQHSVVISSLRHATALERALEGVQRVFEGLDNNQPTDLLAYDLRDTLNELGKITGTIDPDVDILGTLFGEFCVGK